MITHRAGREVARRAQKLFFFPGILAVAEDVCRCCQACQADGCRPKDQRHTSYSWVAGYPFQVVSIDVVGPLTSSAKSGASYLLTAKDIFTKWLEAYPLCHATAEAVADKLVENLFCRFGVPEALHSDQGSQFTSDLVRDVASLLSIRATITIQRAILWSAPTTTSRPT